MLLHGAETPVTQGNIGYHMPGYGWTLNDQQIAELKAELEKQGRGDIMTVIGGVIPQQDWAELEAAGFTDVVNILHGFEGELDEHFKRSTLNGWRFEGLPWEQM